MNLQKNLYIKNSLKNDFAQKEFNIKYNNEVQLNQFEKEKRALEIQHEKEMKELEKKKSRKYGKNSRKSRN